MAKKPASVRKSLPIFAKCLLILAGASLLIAVALTVRAERGFEDIANFSVSTLAKSLTEVSAEQVAGSLKFKDISSIEERLADLVETTGTVRSYVLVDGEGNQLAAFPETLANDDASRLSKLAGNALDNNDTSLSSDGYSIAAPIRYGKDNSVIGGLSIEWQPDQIFEFIANQRLQNIAISVGLVIALATLAGFFIRAMVTKPLEQLTSRTVDMAEGDLATAVPQHGRRDEIGVAAKAIEHLRAKLEGAEGARLDAAYQRAGFQSSGTPTLICDTSLVVTHTNRAFLRFAEKHTEAFQCRSPGFDANAIIGTSPDIFHLPPAQARETMATEVFPFESEVGFDGLLFDLLVNQVLSDDGTPSGFIIEYSNVTETRKTGAIFAALETTQLRADFDGEGKLVALNGPFQDRLDCEGVPSGNMSNLLQRSDGNSLFEGIVEGNPVFATFEFSTLGQTLHLDGSVSPVRTKSGATLGFVLLGTDVTQATKDLAKANQEADRLSAEQASVDEAMREALVRLSEGDLKFRIEKAFGADYESLRENFNSAVSALDVAISAILNSADTILGEADNVASAADDLSKRTEQQAATLEQTAAAVSQLTTSVASASEGASKAQNVVTSARENAESSGVVVQQAVDAMGEIETSSDQISRIIGVIDEIAFQTNLLALNAGVEAARAGDAGRGFAVVASEVRSLAQRSSEAAHEITDLISTSGEHVKTGVSLVDKAGQALNDIVGSVGDIAEHVTAIAASTQEQSTGLDEINTAMAQLDQVTQRNVAMFEETKAATETVRSEANTLVGVTGEFECNRPSPKKIKLTAPPFESGRNREDLQLPPEPQNAPPAASQSGVLVSKTEGNLALAPQEETFQDDTWEEF